MGQIILDKEIIYGRESIWDFENAECVLQVTGEQRNGIYSSHGGGGPKL
jgi:hypothetical protein